jgi:tetraacyldisaccharide 4'-kinase
VKRLDAYWDSVNGVSLLLLPLAGVFGLVVGLRRLLYRLGVLRSTGFPVPVVVVGNISVGGTGKTPLVIWLTEYLRGRGWRPGLVSRGYGGGARHWPQQVRGDSDPASVGDEAVLLARRGGCPVCVGPDRPAAVAALLAHSDCDIVISDDGLQHYALRRDLEIAVIDGVRRFGNGWLLPAGPLREPRRRLRSVDLVVVNGAEPHRGEYAMRLRRPEVVPLAGQGGPEPLGRFAGQAVHGVAGIGNPERFFDLLRAQGIVVLAHAFPDHHRFRAEDLVFEDPELPVLMTEKDAVKCRRFAAANHWVVRVDAEPDAAFVDRLNDALGEKTRG